jgi:hypothetical protein
MDKQEQISKLTLLLIYLTSWEEKEPGTSVHRAWKGYEFDILNKLEEEDLIVQSKTAKSVYLTDAGLEAAKKIEKELRP